jgi:hypothetical protein
MLHHLTRDISDLLEARADNGHGASRYVEALFAKIIAALRRDPRFANITLLELELLLADERNEAEKFLFNAFRDRVQLDEAVDAVHRCLGD